VVDILLTNDDGIEAPGMQTLWQCVQRAGHSVQIWAPSKNWSGAGHFVTIHDSIRVDRDASFAPAAAHRVHGSPADCIRIAAALGTKPDLVLSGVNNGWNLGRDVYRSGTVAAAREAVLSGIPAVALSGFDESLTAEQLAPHLGVLVSLALAHPEHVVNANLPVAPSRWFRLVAPNFEAMTETARVDSEGPGGSRTVRLGRRVNLTGLERMGDVAAVRAGQVAISLLPTRWAASADVEPADRLAAALR
jgi:5'-nucleotidase